MYKLNRVCWRIPLTLTLKVEAFEVNEVDDFMKEKQLILFLKDCHL